MDCCSKTRWHSGDKRTHHPCILSKGFFSLHLPCLKPPRLCFQQQCCGMMLLCRQTGSRVPVHPSLSHPPFPAQPWAALSGGGHRAHGGGCGGSKLPSNPNYSVIPWFFIYYWSVEITKEKAGNSTVAHCSYDTAFMLPNCSSQMASKRAGCCREGLQPKSPFCSCQKCAVWIENLPALQEIEGMLAL